MPAEHWRVLLSVIIARSEPLPGNYRNLRLLLRLHLPLHLHLLPRLRFPLRLRLPLHLHLLPRLRLPLRPHLPLRLHPYLCLNLHTLDEEWRPSLERHALVAILLVLILIWRLIQIRDLALPAWVDSVHHALLVRILLERGQIPDSWGPYLPQVPFYYHFGFHLTAAVFAKLTSVDTGRAVLMMGQIWQAVLALSIYILGVSLWHSPKKALIAMILVGFVSQMPAYYVTWGRYTLLAGLAIMVLAMAAALAGRTMPVAILVAATAITHYYAFFLLILFLVILAMMSVQKRRSIITGGLIGIGLVSPWLWRVFKLGGGIIQVQAGGSTVGYDPAYLWYLLGPIRNYALLVLALAGAVMTILCVRRRQSPNRMSELSLVVWTSVLVGLMGPWRIMPFRPDHAAIVLFLPAVLLAAEGLYLLKRPAAILCVVVVFALQPHRQQ